MRQTLKMAAVISAALWVTACNSEGKGPQGPAGPHTTEVNVITVEPQSQEITVELPGRTRAFMKAEVRPQVSGVIEARSFTEGGNVTAGQSLYQIDAAPYQAALISAKADLERAKANEISTRATAERYRELIGSNSISKQDFDLAEAAYLEAKASVEMAKAAINQAEINLAYTKVEAPISGHISRSGVTPGALVTANQSQALAQISQLDPINVDIVQSSTEMLKLKTQLASGALQQSATTEVTLILEDGSEYRHPGSLKFAEVTVDEGTGSVTMRAEFPNPDGVLLPGMFVRTRMTVGTDPSAILVPQKAISRTPRGEGRAMVVTADNKVEARNVTTAQAIDHQWRILDGLQAGDKVITEGLQRVRPGASVTIQEITAHAAN
ncbi:efflux RND transporter periplasmic adaptor subunit [Ferrimonas kyonanensis]|uniref:efflux RND transporter periplasmic adaptor subunit n=1 Tax=Ferrimonas kyonanensis TaxID=364763 RepID=UPI0004116BA7|nr:efflux RND transporter periplasmic adaptor subunit [Ferrimonas kyonanensis]